MYNFLHRSYISGMDNSASHLASFVSTVCSHHKITFPKCGERISLWCRPPNRLWQMVCHPPKIHQGIVECIWSATRCVCSSTSAQTSLGLASLISSLNLRFVDKLAMRGMINDVQLCHRKEFSFLFSFGHQHVLGICWEHRISCKQVNLLWLRAGWIMEEKINICLWKPVRKFSTEVI